MIEIKRDAYLQQLTMRKDNGMIKVITGIRRCGKSFLLFNIFKRYLQENGVDTDHIIEIALDGIENEELRDPKLCFKYIKDAMKDDEIEVPVQINGKTKAVISIPAEISKEDAIAEGKKAVADKISGNIIKEIYVPKKIINIVVK